MKNSSKIFKLVSFNFLFLTSIFITAQNNSNDFKTDNGSFHFI